MKNKLLKLSLGMLIATSSIHALDVKTWKVDNPSGNDVWIEVEDKPNNPQDWIGVYKKSDNNEWKNVLKWAWAKNTSQANDPGDWYKFEGLADGTYEARFFYNNSYKVEDKVSFKVGTIAGATLTSWHESYTTNEPAWIEIHNKRDKVAHPEDWIGIFQKGSNSDWNNVKDWKWVKDNDVEQSGSQNWYRFDDLTTGQYEARLFYNNEYGADATVRSSVGFSVHANGVNHIYGAEFEKLKKVVIDNSNNDYIVYKPENSIQNAPVILMLGYSLSIGDDRTAIRNEGVMQYLAGLGCYVIGNKIESQDWTDATKWQSYSNALKESITKGADTSKLGIFGHSAGGMAAYYAMRKYKNEGYGANKSFIIDLHGYYAGSMNKNELGNLNDIDSLIIALGGLNGNANETKHIGTNFSEDPRVLLTLSHLLPNTIKKGFVVLETKDHAYSYGKWEKQGLFDAIKDKVSLLKPIDAMVKYEFFNEDGVYNNASDILFKDYKQTIQNVYKATNIFLNNGGKYEYGCKVWNGIDYCNDHGLQ